jgi:hypothetical protein
MRDYTVAKEFKSGKFDIIVDWADEDLSLEYVFETDEEIAEHAERCANYQDTHYAARVRAMYDGKEMGSDHLGSCYAYDCTPEEDIAQEIGGYLEQMVETAVAEADEYFGTLFSKMLAEVCGYAQEAGAGLVIMRNKIE